MPSNLFDPEHDYEQEQERVRRETRYFVVTLHLV
jgi:hypothetical protein